MKIIICSTNIVVILLSITSTSAQKCHTYSFPPNNPPQKFSSCNDLPALNSYLYWTYNTNAGTADIAFRVTGVTSSNWIAWALNPTRSSMIGAQSLVAFRNSSGAVHAYTSSVGSYFTTLAPSPLSFQVTNIRGMAPKSNEMIIFATVKPPKTTVNQVWQVGPLSGGTPKIHSQSGDNMKSVGNINFLSGQITSSTGSAPSPNLHKKNLHGVLNAVSWGIMMPMGAIIARYMKVFESADPAWFYLHATCQFSAYVVGVAGWATGLKLGTQSVGIVYHSHRNIGIALFCLATLQVFALLLRPNKDHKYRLYWNIYHHSIGYTTIILSVTNIYKGLDILDPEKKWKTIYTAIIITLGAIALALEAFTWLVVLKRKKSGSNKHGYNYGYDART